MCPGFGGNKDDHRKNHKQAIRFFFGAVLPAMGKLGNNGDSHSSSGYTSFDSKSAPESGCQ